MASDLSKKSDVSFKTTNPGTGVVLKEWTYYSDTELNPKFETLKNQYQNFKNLGISERSQILMILAQALRDAKKDLSHTMAIEMGKPISQGGLEIDKCALTCEMYADLGPKWLEENFKVENPHASLKQFQVLRDPMGILLGIMPWNFPLWQIIRFLAPQMIVGNGVIIKPSDLVPETSVLLEKILTQTAPEYPYMNLRCSHAQAEKLIAENWIRGVSLTGSVRAGSRIAELAGKNLKKVVLELGGADPYLILEDADLKLSAAKCAASRLQNNGQSCVSAKRFIVHEKVYDEFKELLGVELLKHKIGDPTLKETRRGPLASHLFKEQIQKQIQTLQKEFSMRWVLGSEREINESPEAFFPVCILESPEKYVEATWKEEIFGPVACLWKVKSFEEGFRLCQNSELGLGSAIFSKDPDRVHKFVRETNSGLVAVNDIVQSDPHVPFGGSHKSGFGRELGPQGLFEFVHFKSVV